MRKKKILTGAILISSLVLGACGKSTESETETRRRREVTSSITSEESTSLQDSFDNLFTNTLSNVENKSDNVLLSPYSLVMDFGMLENGSSGATLDELVKHLNGGLSLEELNKIMQESRKNMMDATDVKWNIANSIWLNENIGADVKPELEEVVKKYYESEINKRPYNNETLKEINDWVNDNTNGMIPALLDQLYPDDVMHLLNAVAFEGKWEDGFDKKDIESDVEFTNIDGSTSNVDMLCDKASGYFAGEDFEGFSKAFADNYYRFFAIKPTGDLTPEELMVKLRKENKTVMSIMDEYCIEEMAKVKIPKFTVDYNMNLNDVLMDTGVKKIFSSDADFSNLSDAKGLFVSQVLQKTHFEFSEEGVKAAAASSIGMKKNSAPSTVSNKEIVFDKPFIYGVYDVSTSLPIFIGSMNTME